MALGRQVGLPVGLRLRLAHYVTQGREVKEVSEEELSEEELSEQEETKQGDQESKTQEVESLGMEAAAAPAGDNEEEEHRWSRREAMTLDESAGSLAEGVVDLGVLDGFYWLGATEGPTSTVQRWPTRADESGAE